MTTSETLVYYFFQGELGESMSSPNAFMVPHSSSSLTLGAFLAAFPLQHRLHTMHCRFRASHPSDPTRGYVWQDMSSSSSPSTVLPTLDGIVLAKVLSLDSDVTCLKRKALLRRKQHCQQGGHSTDDDSAFLAPAPVQSDKKREVLAASSTTASPSKKAAARLQEQQSQDEGQSSPSVSPPPPPEHNFFSTSADEYDQNTQTQSQQQRSQPPSVDSSKTNLAPPPAPVLNRADLQQKRHDDIDEKVAQALAEKKERDDRVLLEEQELDEAKVRFDKSLTAWAFDNGKKRNVRTLLSTMHTVVWPGCKWKALGLGDLLSPKQVKLAYRKAMLVVHTDKCSGMDTETRFIAMRLFEAINEAYELFVEAEGSS